MLLEQPFKKLVENHFHIDAKTLISFAKARRVIEIESDANLMFDSSGEQFLVRFTDRKATHEQCIVFTASKVGYGERLFVSCPKCSSPTNALYFRYSFTCRVCSGLYYSSTMKQHNKMKRYELDIRKLHKALKIPISGLMDRPEAKPKYMHNKTYERLLSELIQTQQAYTTERTKRVNKILKIR